MNPLTWLQAALSGCTSKYGRMLNLKARTDDALYDAVKDVYAVYIRLRTNDKVRDAFHHVLASNKMRAGSNEALALVQFAFFPHVLARRANPEKESHKADIDKASCYAKVILYAYAHRVKPEEFLKFIRSNGGLQATAKAEAQRNPRHAKQPGVRLGKFAKTKTDSAGPTRVSRSPNPGCELIPMILWCSTSTAAKINTAATEAYYSNDALFVIRGRWSDTNNALVTHFGPPPRLRPVANLSAAAMRRNTATKRHPTGWEG